MLKWHLIWLIALAPVEPLRRPIFCRLELHIIVSSCSHEIQEDTILFWRVKILDGIFGEKIIHNVFERDTFNNFGLNFPWEIFIPLYLFVGLASPCLYLLLHFRGLIVETTVIRRLGYLILIWTCNEGTGVFRIGNGLCALIRNHFARSQLIQDHTEASVSRNVAGKDELWSRLEDESDRCFKD